MSPNMETEEKDEKDIEPKVTGEHEKGDEEAKENLTPESDDDEDEFLEDMQHAQVESSRLKPVKYYKWLYDRCDGTSRYNASWGRPPCFICFVPLPVRWFADYIEMNVIFEWIGRRGCVDPENPKLRKWFFSLALVCNFTSFALTLFACLAATMENHTLLRASSFTRGVFQYSDGRPDTMVDLGLRAVAVTNDPDFGTSIVRFGRFCDEAGRLNQTELITKEECDTCDKASFPIIFSLVMGLVFTFPTVTTVRIKSFRFAILRRRGVGPNHVCCTFSLIITKILPIAICFSWGVGTHRHQNFLRMWPNYDVNCQKVFGAIVGLISLFFSCYSWFGYTTACFNNFPQYDLVFFGKDNVTSVEEFNAQSSSQSFSSDNVIVRRDWDAGHGLICIVAATLLKIVDSVFNWVVPTPSITRDHDEQKAYEYMSQEQRNMSAFHRMHVRHRRREQLTPHGLGMVTADPGVNEVDPEKSDHRLRLMILSEGRGSRDVLSSSDIRLPEDDVDEEVPSKHE